MPTKKPGKKRTIERSKNQLLESMVRTWRDEYSRVLKDLENVQKSYADKTLELEFTDFCLKCAQSALVYYATSGNYQSTFSQKTPLTDWHDHTIVEQKALILEDQGKLAREALRCAGVTLENWSKVREQLLQGPGEGVVNKGENHAAVSKARARVSAGVGVRTQPAD
jgi:hypothetical protein